MKNEEVNLSKINITGAISKANRELAKRNSKKILEQIALNSREQLEFGEPYILLKCFTQSYQLGMISAKDLEKILYLLLILEICRLYKSKKETESDYLDLDNDEVDTSQLVPGMIFKNYKDLCTFLKEPIQTGKAKMAQMKRWLRFFDYEKILYGNEIIILDVYIEPLPSNICNKYRASQFSNELKVLILRKLSEQMPNAEGNIIFLTTYEKLIKSLDLINEHFYNDAIINYILRTYSDLFTKANIKWNLKVLKSAARLKIKDSLTYALNSLARDNLISFYCYNIIAITSDGTTTYHEATDDEQAYIDYAKKEAANEIGYANSRLADYYQPEIFREKLTRYYKDKGWDYVYYQIKLITRQTNLLKHINEYTALNSSNSVVDMSSDYLSFLNAKYNSELSDALLKQANDKIKNLISKVIYEFRKSNSAACDNLSDQEIIDIYFNNALQYGDSIIMEICGSNYDKEFVKRQEILIDNLVRKKEPEPIQ